MKILAAADIAFARVNDSCAALDASASAAHHCGRAERPGATPAPAADAGEERRYGPIPAFGEHTEMIRKEFAG